MMQKNIFKGVTLSGIMWASIATAQPPLNFEIFNEGINTEERRGYAVQVICTAVIKDGTLTDSSTAVLHELPLKGKGVLLEIDKPFPSLTQAQLPWVNAQLSWSVQVYKEEPPFFRSNVNSAVWKGDISGVMPSNKIILRSCTDFSQDVGALLDSVGDAIRKGELRPMPGKTHYFR